MTRRVRSDGKTKSKSSVSPHRLRLFRDSLVLEDEDPTAYQQLLARIHASVKPRDAIDEIFVQDIASLQWEIVRWQRLRLGFMRARCHRALESFLSEKLQYSLYREEFAYELAEDLRERLREDQAEDAEKLARAYAEGDRVAYTKVIQVLGRIEMDKRDHEKGEQKPPPQDLVKTGQAPWVQDLVNAEQTLVAEEELQDLAKTVRARKAKWLVGKYMTGEARIRLADL